MFLFLSLFFPEAIETPTEFKLLRTELQKGESNTKPIIWPNIYGPRKVERHRELNRGAKNPLRGDRPLRKQVCVCT